MKKRIIRLIFIFVMASSLFAKDLYYKCEYSGIPFWATGTYICNDLGKIMYINPMTGSEIDLLEESPFLESYENLKITKNFVYRNIYDIYGNNFCDFDENGNFYFAGSLSYTTLDYGNFNPDYIVATDVVFIYKFNPVNLSLTYIKLNENSTVNSLCVAKNGKWIFVNTYENMYDNPNCGKSVIYSIPTDFSSNPQVIYSSDMEEEILERSINNICFEKNTNTLYFYFSEYAGANLPGLYSLNADINGNYLKNNLSHESFDYNKSCKLYSNSEGLWGVIEALSNPALSSLIHIKDDKGKRLKDYETRISGIKIYGRSLFKPYIHVYEDSIYFVNESKTKIFKYSKDVLSNVTSYYQHKESYTADDLVEIDDFINSNDSATVVPKYLFLIMVYISIVLGVALIILISWVLLLTRKSNQIKKDKQFIFNIQEKERGEISRDIHDSIIQDIRAIRIETELLNVDDGSKQRQEKIINLATECVVKLRNICYNLTPAELATHTDGDNSKIELVSIIQTLVLQFIERTHVPCSLKIDENFEYIALDKDVSQNLFRIIQEALNNIEKHSYATNCQILLKNKTENEKKYMLIYISDDGVGCDVNQIMKRKNKFHFGINNMMERALLIGAEVEFQSEPGQGLEIKIKI